MARAFLFLRAFAHTAIVWRAGDSAGSGLGLGGGGTLVLAVHVHMLLWEPLRHGAGEETSRGSLSGSLVNLGGGGGVRGGVVLLLLFLSIPLSLLLRQRLKFLLLLVWKLMPLLPESFGDLSCSGFRVFSFDFFSILL